MSAVAAFGDTNEESMTLTSTTGGCKSAKLAFLMRSNGKTSDTLDFKGS